MRKVTDVPVVGHPLRLRVRVPRYRCMRADCDREVFSHNTDRLARRGWTTTRRCARYVLRRLMCDRMTVSAVARPQLHSKTGRAGKQLASVSSPTVIYGSRRRSLENPGSRKPSPASVSKCSVVTSYSTRLAGPNWA